MKNGKDRAFKYYLEIVNGGKATFDQLDERMDAFRAEEEAKFTSGRYRQPWQYTREPTAWLRDGHYQNKTEPIAAPTVVLPAQDRAPTISRAAAVAVGLRAPRKDDFGGF